MALTPEQIPTSGDMAELSKRLGISQEEIVALRRQKFTGQVTGDEGKPGERELSSFAERSALGAGATGTGTVAESYWDASRGVQVHAPYGKSFELLPGGGVTVVDTPAAGVAGAPASTLFTQPTTGEGAEKKPVEGLVQEQLGITPAAGKTIARTGQTVKNPQTGVDVYADPGNIYIEYTDGTVEQRPITSIGTPGEAKPIGEVGPTAKELGITRQTEIKGGPGPEVTRAPMKAETVAQMQARGATPEELEAAVGAAGLAKTEDLEFIGTEYTSATGQRRVAAEGNAFYQDVKTRKILERPLDLQGFAQETTSPSILAEREAAQPVSADNLLSQYGVTANPGQFQVSPVMSFEDTYQKLLDSMGVTDIRSAKLVYEQKLEKIDAAYAKELREIDGNPWLSESLRNRKREAVKGEYDLQRSQLVAELTLMKGWDDTARADARFVATTALQQYNADRQFQFDVIENAYQRADTAFTQRLQLANLRLNEAQLDEKIEQFRLTYGLNVEKFETETQLDLMRIAKGGGGSPYASIKSAQGGLVDISTGEWLVPPTPNVQTVGGGLYDVGTGQFIVQGEQQKLQALAQQVASAGANAYTSNDIRQLAQSMGLDANSDEVKQIVGAANTAIAGWTRKYLGF